MHDQLVLRSNAECKTYSQVSVLEQRDKVCLGRLLQSHDCTALESEVGLEVLCDFADKTLEGKFADEEFGGLHSERAKRASQCQHSSQTYVPR